MNVIACPGCRRPLHVPDAAIGRPAHCPHCRVWFTVPRAANGTPGAPVLVPRRLQLPRLLYVPAFGMLMLGLAGTLVNGYLTALFALVPGQDVEFARGRVREVRSAQSISDLTRWEPAPHAALAGGAAGYQAWIQEAARLDEELAHSWGPGMLPLHVVSTATSLVVLLGGVAVLRGRFYYFTLFACAASMLNVNHLCCLPGTVVGLWGILTIVRDEGRRHFGK